MTIKLTDLPIYEPDPERSRKQVQEAVVKEGRAAYRAGLPVSRCPPYRIHDWVLDWQNGWRWEKEEREARKR